MKTLKEAIVNSFYPDLPKIDKEEILNVPIIIMDVTIVEDWESAFGVSDFPIFKLCTVDDPKTVYTCLISGKAVLRQARRLIKRELLPGQLQCTLCKREAESGYEYYSLE